MRGNRRPSDWGKRSLRSIPACAGEPPAAATAAYRRRVYPRVCGGTDTGRFARPVQGGLSPRVRGNQHHIYVGCDVRRSIPACAGEPGMRCPLSPSRQVYPRVCGGTYIRGLLWGQRRGLSPRVRGNHRWSQQRCSKTRSIPACAGEPLVPLGQVQQDGVYPRVCGGTCC